MCLRLSRVYVSPADTYIYPCFLSRQSIRYIPVSSRVSAWYILELSQGHPPFVFLAPRLRQFFRGVGYLRLLPICPDTPCVGLLLYEYTAGLPLQNLSSYERKTVLPEEKRRTYAYMALRAPPLTRCNVSRFPGMLFACVGNTM